MTLKSFIKGITPPYLIRFAKCLLKKRIYRIADFTELQKKDAVVYFSGEKAKVYFDECFDFSKIPQGSSEEYRLPDFFSAKQKNVCAYGEMEFFFAKKKLYCPYSIDMTDMNTDRYTVLDGSRALIIRDLFSLKIPKGILLTWKFSYNYFHFMAQVLPKIVLLTQKNMYPDYPFILDEGIKKFPSIMEALSMANVHNNPLVFVPRGKQILVQDAVVLSEVDTMPKDLKKDANGNEISDNTCYLFSSFALGSTRKFFIKRYNLEAVKPWRKIYLRRKSYVTSIRLINDYALANIAAKMGFEVVAPEELTLREQIKLFCETKYVIGSSGAAMTGTMWMHPNSVVAIISSKTWKSIWAPFVYAAGAICYYIDAEVVSKGKNISQDIIYADEDNFREKLALLCKD